MEPWWEPAVRDVVGGRRVILAGGIAVSWTPIVPILRRAGATDVLVVATEGLGVGPQPDARTVAVERPDELSMMEHVRRGIEALRDPPDHVCDAVEAFDPDNDAVVITHFLNESPTLCGRPTLHHRPARWLALEDKVTIDAVWDAAGVARAPAEVVELSDAIETAARLDRGDGTVWSADATHGWHGGGSHTHWVVDESDARASTTALAPVCDRVRVMPFLEGIPCSIHGVVCADGTVVLRPVEMITLRRRRELFYAGCCTFWDPDPARRAEMRGVARQVGEHLRSTVAYRGAFTIDGVVTADGFRPTELNPRPGAGLGLIQRSLDDGTPLLLLVDLVAAGVDPGRPADDLEHEWLAAADSSRAGGSWRFAESMEVEVASFDLWFDDAGWHVDTTDHPAPAAAPRASGFVSGSGARVALDPATWPAGPSVAPAAAAFYRFLDEHHRTSYGVLEPARQI